MKQQLPKQVLISFLAGATLLLIQNTVSAQEEASSPCAVNLQNAQAAFDRGQVEQVPSLLEECLRSGFTNEEQLSAYKLIIQTLLFEDKLAEADSAMLSFLKNNPEYELSPTDHSSFVTLFNTFQVKPVFQLSVHLGSNIPYITFIDPNSGSPETPDRKYTSKVLNFYGSLEARFKISDKLDLNFEPAYSLIKFSNVEKFTTIINGITQYDETQTRIDLPLSVIYNFKSYGKLTPYARLGGGPSLILSAKGNAEFNPLDENNQNTRTPSELDRDDSRINLDVFAQIGGGIKFKTLGGYFFTELRTNAGILNQTVKGGDSYEELCYRYYYADDRKFHINALNFNFGYTWIFYKPLKRI